ncbi:MAG: hypothetical protein Q9222_002136 [Ikaeria aurantiellina]
MEAVALIASVVTLAATLNEGLKKAKSLLHAQREFEDLQDQLQHLVVFLKSIGDEHSMQTIAVVKQHLPKARLLLEQLDRLIRNKILHIVNGTTQVRLRAWARHKSKMCRMVLHKVFPTLITIHGRRSEDSWGLLAHFGLQSVRCAAISQKYS